MTLGLRSRRFGVLRCVDAADGCENVKIQSMATCKVAQLQQPSTTTEEIPAWVQDGEGILL